MDRKAVARQTLEILKRGSYEQGGRTVELAAVHKRSVEGSRLFTPEEGERILRSFEGRQVQQIPTWGYKNCSTVDAVLEFARRGDRHIGVLNFASAKNPGGGFLNGAMAQRVLQKLDMGEIIQVDNRAQFGRVGKLLRRRVVGGKHDLLPGKSAGLGHHKLRHGRAVRAAAALL